MTSTHPPEYNVGETGAFCCRQSGSRERGERMYIADLHIHSRYSRATSKDCTPEYLDLWAARKGIHIVGTGDFTHPAWREELAEKLEPAEEGLYVLKDEYRIDGDRVPGEIRPRFVVTGEISSIYKKNGKVRKVHSLILLPGLEAAEKISRKLERIGNIHSDGRPILGLDCHDLLEIVLELCPEAVYVPAHIWTPHFSLFGAFSGFDTVEECFEDLTPYIHAVETGLSSDPPMNWRVSALDRFHLISNSDAHSPAKLGREANLLDIPMSYEGLAGAIQTGKGLYGTIEFFPEEGKYHMDGHRKCGICLTPSETIKHQGVCPVCGRKITIGVSHRVEELADRPEGYQKPDAAAFESLVPLPEVIGASSGHSAASKKVEKEYMHMLSELGPEFEILRNIPLDDICRVSGNRIAEGIGRLREGKVERIPGFDGEYGIIRLFSTDELSNTEGQMDFFGMLGVNPGEDERHPEGKKSDGNSAEEGGAEASAEKAPVEKELASAQAAQESPQAARESGLNPEQRRAVCSLARKIAVKAGPGTGKTKTLVSHLCYLLENRRVSPSEITAVTFTNQAAGELRERIARETGKKQAVRRMQIGTFHALCLDFLKQQGEVFSLAGEEELAKLAAEVSGESSRKKVREFLEQVSRRKAGMDTENMQETELAAAAENSQWEQAYAGYEAAKQERGLYDFDDLLLKTIEKIESGNVPAGWKKRFHYLLVDEFQDINPVQYRLIELWSRQGRELFVIGDPDQSIYGFRGADATCFKRLKKDNCDLELIELKENYRSTPQVLSAASAVIPRAGILHANSPDNVPVRVVHAGSPMGEAIFIAKEINRLAGGIGMLEAHQAAWEQDGRKIRGFGDIAVLCRTHHQAELVEKCLIKEGIPYIVAGREDFLKDPAVQGSIHFFHYIEDPENLAAAESCAEELWQLEWNTVTEEIIRSTAEKFRPLYEKKKPQKVLEEWMKEMKLEGNPAMEKLSRMTVFHSSMKEMLEALLLGVESDLKRCGGKKYTSEAVTLMTLHGSKGLEFPAVFIYGAEKGSIPYESEKHPSDVEEERRLFYVGITRAKEELLITTSGEMSEFLESVLNDSKEENVVLEEAEKKKQNTEFHQMSLFEL